MRLLHFPFPKKYLFHRKFSSVQHNTSFILKEWGKLQIGQMLAYFSNHFWQPGNMHWYGVKVKKRSKLIVISFCLLSIQKAYYSFIPLMAFAGKNFLFSFKYIRSKVHAKPNTTGSYCIPKHKKGAKDADVLVLPALSCLFSSSCTKLKLPA